MRTDPHGGRLEAPYFATRVWSLVAPRGWRERPLSGQRPGAGAGGGRRRAGRCAPRWARPRRCGWRSFFFGSVAFTAVFRWQSELLVFAAVVSPAPWSGAASRRRSSIAERTRSTAVTSEGRGSLALAARRPAARRRGRASSRLRPDRDSDAVRSAGNGKARQQGPGRRALRGLLCCCRSVSSWPRKAPPGRRLRPFFHPALLGWNALYLAIGRHAGLVVGLPAAPRAAALAAQAGRTAIPAARRRGGGVRPVADGAVRLGRRSLRSGQPLVPAALRRSPRSAPVRPCTCARRSSSRSRSCRSWRRSGSRRSPTAPATGGARGVHVAPAGTAAVRNLAARPPRERRARAGRRRARAAPDRRSGSTPPAGDSPWTLRGRWCWSRATAPSPPSGSTSAPTRRRTLAVEGGTTGSTTFRPSGEVAFDISLGKPATAASALVEPQRRSRSISPAGAPGDG